MREASWIPDGPVREAAEVEIGAQLAVDPHEKVPIERRRDAKGIIVGQQQIALRLQRGPRR